MRGIATALAGLCLMLATPGAASAQFAHDTVKIGVMADFSGVYMDVGGQGSLEAARLAAEEFGGTVAGHKIEIVYADAQNKPDIASSIARRWYDEEGVGLIVDLPASSVGLAVQEVARERKKINVVTGGGTSDLTGKFCSPTGFHWVWDTYAMSHGAAQAIVRNGGKTWFFITGDFNAAVTLEREASDAIISNGGKILGSARTPFPNADFSSQILLAQQSGAQIIGLANAGQDSINAIKQAREFGVTPKQGIVGLITYISEIHAVGLATTAGMQFMTGFYWDRDEASRAWSETFGARMGGKMPTMSQAGVYSATRHYLQAVKDIGTDDGLKIAAQMKATPINDMLAKDGHLRPDGVMEHDLYLVQVKTPAESKAPWDYYKILETVPGSEAFLPLAKSGCPLLR